MVLNHIDDKGEEKFQLFTRCSKLSDSSMRFKHLLLGVLSLLKFNIGEFEEL